MRTLGRICIIFLLIGISCAGKTVDVLTSAGLGGLEEEQIIRVLSRNKSESMDNTTFVELIGRSPRNRTAGRREDVWTIGKMDGRLTNVYYDNFSEEIDREARRLFQLVPPYDPAAGHVSTECRRHADIFHRELAKFTLWALKMYDATAKMPAGLLSGNVNQFGDYDECIGVEGSEGIQGQYCLAHLQLDIDQSRSDLKHLHRLLHSHYAFKSNMTDPGHRVPRFSTINWGICSPASCSSQDVQSSLRDVLDKYTSQTGIKISVNVNKEMCQIKRKGPLPRETVYASLFFAAIIALTFVAMYYDHYKIPASELLLSFSLKRNFNKLISLESGKDDIPTLHGVRAFNAYMLILAHKSMALFFNPYINRTGMSEYLGKPWTVVGRAASLYTDPFIMLSGLLTAHSFLKKLRKNGNLDIKNEYLSRLFRLVPTLGALILFCTFVMPFIGSGPQWNLTITEHSIICKKTGWRNFLFIQNYFGFENICLTHTHHLSIDTQLFVLSPLLILLLYKSPKFGAVVLAAIAFISTMLRYYVTYFKELNNYVFFGTSIQQLFDTADYSYMLPTHRLTVYIIGIFMGYMLTYLPKDYKFNTATIYIGWILSTVMWFAAVLIPAKMGSIDYVYDPIQAAKYNAFSPIGWCAIFAWTTILHYTGNTNGYLSRMLSWKGFLISTRLSYAIYLTQFPVFFYNVGRTRSAEYYDFVQMQLNLDELFCIIMASVVLTILFDMPFQNIKNYLLKKSGPSERTIKTSKVE